MSDSENQQGPLSIDQITAIWAKAVDKSYSEPFIAAGDGGGFEAYRQGFAQYARVSEAIDVTTQSNYILPWSGQTNPPASGASNSTCTFMFNRSKYANIPLRIASNVVMFEELVNDWGLNGPVPTLTGRQYALQNDVVFAPGDLGPHSSLGSAENPG